MPTRILRDGILTSIPVNNLSPEAEILYRRLFSVADDYGRFFGHEAIIRANCYPLQLENYPESKIVELLKEIRTQGLLVLFEIDGKKYIEISNFKQRTRSDSKFPAPPPQDSGEAAAKPPQNSAVDGDGDGDGDDELAFDVFWKNYPRKDNKKKSRTAWGNLTKTKKRLALKDLKTRFEGVDKKYIMLPTTYLHGERWEDDAQTLPLTTESDDPFRGAI